MFELVDETMKSGVLALIVAEPGPLRNSLRAMLVTIPQIGAVSVTDVAASALRAVTEHRPALVLLDASLPNDEAHTVAKRLMVEWPHTRCLVLADNIQQQQEFKAAGADKVLLKGFPAAKLFETIERLLSEQET